jgi:hypothetical protein
MSNIELPIDQKNFYSECANILGIVHEFSPKYPHLNRWNHRQLGNGRFPGRGVIRWYASNQIHLAFKAPLITKIFKSKEDCWEYLKTLTNM